MMDESQTRTVTLTPLEAGALCTLIEDCAVGYPGWMEDRLWSAFRKIDTAFREGTHG